LIATENEGTKNRTLLAIFTWNHASWQFMQICSVITVRNYSVDGKGKSTRNVVENFASRGVQSIVMCKPMSVCLSVCLSVRSHNWKTAWPNFAKYFMHVTRVSGSVLLWRRCDTLYTSGLSDDVMFSYRGTNEQYQARLYV